MKTFHLLRKIVILTLILSLLVHPEAAFARSNPPVLSDRRLAVKSTESRCNIVGGVYIDDPEEAQNAQPKVKVWVSDSDKLGGNDLQNYYVGESYYANYWLYDGNTNKSLSEIMNIKFHVNIRMSAPSGKLYEVNYDNEDHKMGRFVPDRAGEYTFKYSITGDYTWEKTISIMVKDKPADKGEKSLAKLLIVKTPSKTTYVVGEQLSTMGMIVVAQYSDGTTKHLSDYKVSADLSKAGVKNAVVSYSEGGITQSANYQITVNEKPKTETHQHKYVENITKKATCTEQGQKTFTCECGATYSESIEKTEHNWQKTNTIHSDRPDVGHSIVYRFYECTTCHETKSEHKVEPYDPNRWADGSNTVANDKTKENDQESTNQNSTGSDQGTINQNTVENDRQLNNDNSNIGNMDHSNIDQEEVQQNSNNSVDKIGYEQGYNAPIDSQIDKDKETISAVGNIGQNNQTQTSTQRNNYSEWQRDELENERWNMDQEWQIDDDVEYVSSDTSGKTANSSKNSARTDQIYTNDTGGSKPEAMNTAATSYSYFIYSVGDRAQDMSGMADYEIIKKASSNHLGSVKYLGNLKKQEVILIPAVVVLDDKNAYQVVGIADNALKNDKKVKKVIIGEFVKSIGADAFRGCTSLRTIEVQSGSLKKSGISKHAFRGTSSRLTIKLPTIRYTNYKKWFKKCGTSRKVRYKII